MSAPARETMRRGWCPGTLRPMATGDGLLVRLHPPRNALTPVVPVRPEASGMQSRPTGRRRPGA